MKLDEESLGKRIMDSTLLTVSSRLATIGAAALLPVAAFLGAFAFNRAVTAFDELGKKVDELREQTVVRMDETTANIRLIQQSQRQEIQMLADHEIRLRRLEEIARARTVP